MKYVIDGKTIRYAVSNKLRDLYPDYGIDFDSKPPDLTKYPNFFINQLNVGITRDIKNHSWLTYLIDVEFRAVKNPLIESNLNQILDMQAIQLLTDLDTIEVNEIKVFGENQYYEKSDDVVHMFSTFRLFTELSPEAVAKMMALEIKTMELEIKTR